VNKINSFFVGAVCVSVLTACGGGGSSAASASDAVSTPPVTPTAPVVATDVRDAYVGTWVTSSCKASTQVQQSNAQFVRQKVTTTMAKASGSTTVLSATLVTRFFDSTDIGCTGTVLTTETRNGATWTIGTATKSMTLPPNTVAATAVNISASAINSGLSAGNSISINGLVYPGNYFTVALNSDLFAYIPEAGKLYTAPAAATEFDGTTLMVKQ
jgi:hypothetical protein